MLKLVTVLFVSGLQLIDEAKQEGKTVLSLLTYPREIPVQGPSIGLP